MEENKDYLKSDKLQGESLGRTPIPTGGNLYAEIGKKGVEKPQLPARISNTLSENITANLSTIEKKYNLTVYNSVVKQAVDDSGRIQKLSPMHKKLLLAIQAQISTRIEEPEIKEFIERLERGEINPGFIEIFISLDDLTAKVFGEEERWKKRPQQVIKDELLKLSQIKQLQIRYGKIVSDDGEPEKAIFSNFDAYFTLLGNERRAEVGRRTYRFIKMRFGQFFFDKIRDRYFPLLPTFWQAKKSNGKKISTDIFYTLATLAFDLCWSHYRNFWKLSKDNDFNKIIDTEKKAKKIEEILTHTPISFDRIKSVSKGKTEERVEKIRFKNYLWEAMWSLIDYGLLTSKSSIDWENETFTLVFNPDYNTIRQKQLPLLGEWSKNPFEK